MRTVRTIPDPGFAGDDGSSSAEVRTALASYDQDPEARHHATLAAIQESRVLVPVVALLGEIEYDDQGLAHDKTSDMAAVLITGADGRKALLAFTGSEALQAWNPDARPVPVPLRHAARAALQDEADALLIDVAGPVLMPIEGADLRALAEDFTLARVEGAWHWVKAAP